MENNQSFVNHPINFRLKDLRAKKGVIMQEVSEATGINLNTLYGYEREPEPVMPRPNKLRILSEYYGVSVNYLLTGEESIEGNNQSNAPKWAEELKRVNDEILKRLDKFMELQTGQVGSLIELLSKNKGSIVTDNVFPINGQRQSEKDSVIGWY